MTAVAIENYQLVGLESVRRDDVRQFLGTDPGVYVCNAPTEGWFLRNGNALRIPSTMDKKRAMFACMAPGSRWLSPTFVSCITTDTEDWAESEILHMGYGPRRGRSAQLVQTLKLGRWLRRHRHEFAYVLIYNLPLPTSVAPLMARLGTTLKVFVDYEDDYTLQRQSRMKNTAERMLRWMVDGAICVNDFMVDSFPGRPTCVVNSFADVTPFRSAPLFDGVRLLYSGTLDPIRGADLIPALVKALREVLTRFSIHITGDGPLRPTIESWNYPEVKYHGLLAEQDYDRQLEAADVCLVLQRPDHPFSRGSYPSKIQAYIRHGKPVLVLRSPDGVAPW